MSSAIFILNSKGEWHQPLTNQVVVTRAPLKELEERGGSLSLVYWPVESEHGRRIRMDTRRKQKMKPELQKVFNILIAGIFNKKIP